MTPSAENEAYTTVRICRQLPFGLLVSLDDGRRGIIREREIAWDREERRHWREHFQPGDSAPAVLLDKQRDQHLELSLRLARNDPWRELDARKRLGQTVTGVVTGIQPYGVFIEIEPGVTGLLHRSRLPAWAQDTNIEELFWPGDQVKVTIELINLKDRRIGLSLSRALSQRWKTLDLSESLTHTVDTIGSYLAIKPNEPIQHTIDLLLQTPTWSILVVEDDRDQLESITKWLRRAGQRVLPASNAEEGLALLAREQFDLVVMDLGLPGINGIQGIAQVRERQPSARCALMTDWARADEHLSELERLRAAGVHLLLKPLLPEDLLNVLGDTRNPPADHDGHPAPMPIENELLHQLAARPTYFGELLARLRAVTYAAKVVLFALDPAQRKISVVGESGVAPLQPRALVDLIYSPVRDVAEDGRVVRVEDARAVETRVRYLAPLIDFRSCLGFPVPCELSERYALFLFAPRARAFGPAREAHVRAAALTIGTLLDRQQFQASAAGLQRLALLGQLSRALVHEMNHQLSPINFALTDLEGQCKRVEELADEPGSTLRDDMHEAHELLANLAEGVRRLTETARLFGRMTIQRQDSPLDIVTVVQEVIRLVRDTADRAHVTIDLFAAPTLPPIKTQAVQLQQILLNIVINAIQQIALVRPREGGRIRIEMAEEQREQVTVLQISVEDDGPGIHRRLWERIFELGFTTRRDGGSGLGLYVTRSLVEALSGRVSVTRSCMLWGTTFVIELPVMLPGGADDADSDPR